MRSVVRMLSVVSGVLGMASVSLADGSAVSACSSPGPHVNFLSIFANVSSQTEIVTCAADPLTFPIGSEDDNGTLIRWGNGVRLARLRVVDGHPTEDIICFLYARSSTGVNFVSAQVRTTGMGDVDIAGGLSLTPGAASMARVTLQCSVPPPAPGTGAGSGIVDFNAAPITNF